MAATTHGDQPTGREFERAKDVIRRTRLSRTHVYDLLRSGVVPTVKVGRTVLVERGAFDAYIAEHVENPRPSAAGRSG